MTDELISPDGQVRDCFIWKNIKDVDFLNRVAKDSIYTALLILFREGIGYTGATTIQQLCIWNAAPQGYEYWRLVNALIGAHLDSVPREAPVKKVKTKVKPSLAIDFGHADALLEERARAVRGAPAQPIHDLVVQDFFRRFAAQEAPQPGGEAQPERLRFFGNVPQVEF